MLLAHCVETCVDLKVTLCMASLSLSLKLSLSLSLCSMEAGSDLAGKAKSGLESSRSRKGHISEMLGSQDDALRGMDVWQQPPPMSRPASALERERKVGHAGIFSVGLLIGYLPHRVFSAN